MRSNEPDQPNPNLTRILTLGANLIRLNPILDLEGMRAQPDPKTGWVYIGLNPNLNPF